MALQAPAAPPHPTHGSGLQEADPEGLAVEWKHTSCSPWRWTGHSVWTWQPAWITRSHLPSTVLQKSYTECRAAAVLLLQLLLCREDPGSEAGRCALFSSPSCVLQGTCTAGLRAAWQHPCPDS